MSSGLLVGLGAAPSTLPVHADAPLLPAVLDPPAWAAWAAIAVSVLVGLAALRWLVAQAVRVPAAGTWPLAAELSARGDVRSATARLTGPHAHPTLHLRVTADDGVSLVELRRHIDEVAVPRFVAALELPALDADVLVRLT